MPATALDCGADIAAPGGTRRIGSSDALACGFALGIPTTAGAAPTFTEGVVANGEESGIDASGVTARLDAACTGSGAVAAGGVRRIGSIADEDGAALGNAGRSTGRAAEAAGGVMGAAVTRAGATLLVVSGFCVSRSNALPLEGAVDTAAGGVAIACDT